MSLGHSNSLRRALLVGLSFLGLTATDDLLAQSTLPIQASSRLVAGWDFEFTPTSYGSLTAPGVLPANYSDKVTSPVESNDGANAGSRGVMYLNGTNGSSLWSFTGPSATAIKNTAIGDADQQVLSRNGDATKLGGTGGLSSASLGNRSTTSSLTNIAFVLNTTEFSSLVGVQYRTRMQRDGVNGSITWSLIVNGATHTLGSAIGNSGTIYQTKEFLLNSISLGGATSVTLVAAVNNPVTTDVMLIDNLAIYGEPAGATPAPVISSVLTATATVGTPFSYTITASNSPTAFGATGLPAWATVNTTTGAISGTPDVAAVSNATITATNAGGTDTETLVLTVNTASTAPGFATHPGNATVTAGANASFTIAVNGNPTPTIQWQSMPSGGSWSNLGSTLGTATVTGATSPTLNLSGVTASLSGYSFRALAGNSVQADVASNAATLTVNVPAVISSGGHPLPRTITAGASTTFVVAAEGTAPITYTWESKPAGSSTWTVVAGPTLGGATVSGVTGATLELSGVPAGLNGTSFRALVSNPAAIDVATDAALLTVNAIPLNPPVITSGLAANGTVNVAFAYQISATNAPTSYSATSLPAGLSINTTSGLISGTPSAGGSTVVSITATNADGFDTKALTITIAAAPVPEITSALTRGGTAGEILSYQITATNAPTSFSATGLPAGLALNAATGVISGTPATTGVTQVTLSAANGNGAGPTATLTLTIVAGPTSEITSLLTKSGSVGQALSYQVTASNTPTSFSATGLPAGLTINATTGLISGTPTATGITSVTLSAANGNGAGASATLVITIAPPSAPVMVNPQLKSGRVGEAFSYQVQATYAETYGSGALPAGLTLNTNTGLITGTPTTAIDVAVAISATNSVGTTNGILALTILPQPPVINNVTDEIVLQVNQSFTLDVEATNSPTSICTNALPAGLDIVCATGVISGTPTTAGDTLVVLTATNDGGQTTKNVLFRVVSHPTADTFFKRHDANGVSYCLFVRGNRTGIFTAYFAGADDVITEREVIFGADWTFSFVIDSTASSGGNQAAPITISGSVTGVAAVFGMTGSSATWTADLVSGGGSGSVQTLFLVGQTTGTVYNIVFPDGSVQAFIDANGLQDFGSAATSTANSSTVTTLQNYVVAADSSGAGTVTGSLSLSGVQIPLAGTSGGAEPARNLINLSGRSYVNGQANPSICGFVIEGTQPAKVLIRAAGPALTPFGVTGVLADPRLTIYNNARVSIGANDDWSAGSPAVVDEIRSVRADVGAFAFADGSKDAAIVITLDPGVYTAVASGPGVGDAGVTIVEVYDSNPNADPARVSRLVNSSVRAWVATGDGATNGGFIIRGNSPKKIVVRAIGPTLGTFGVADPLVDPVLTVFNRTSGAQLAGSDDWSTSTHKADLIAAFASVGAFALPDPSADSAVLITLAPGEYTAIVTGKAGGSGNTLLEIYEVAD